MRWHLGWGAAFLVSLATAVHAEQAREVTVSSLNVRSGPGTGYSIIGTVGSAQKYVVISSSGSWYQIWWAGSSGWIYGGYTIATPGTGTTITLSSLNIRTGPSTSYSIVGTAGWGQIYVQITSSGGWKKIWFGGAGRWCYGAYTSSVSLSGTVPPPPPTPPPSAGWVSSYVGIDLDGSHLPREGLANGTLQSALGRSVEPYGQIVTWSGHLFVQGKVSEFGGPDDSDTAGETVALTGEWAHDLNNPMNPSAGYLATHLEQYYYCAMRWDYAPNGPSWWRAQRILVINSANGRAIVVRPVDWGPHTNTGRVLDLSPQAIDDLGLDTDQDAIVAFVSSSTTLGVK